MTPTTTVAGTITRINTRTIIMLTITAAATITPIIIRTIILTPTTR